MTTRTAGVGLQWRCNCYVYWVTSTAEHQDRRSAIIVPLPEHDDGEAIAVNGERPQGIAGVRGQGSSVVVFLACVVALQWARPVLVPILFGILISYALDPIVTELSRYRVPRTIAAVTVFVGTFVGVSVATYEMARPAIAAVDQLPSAAQTMREAVESWRGGSPGPVAKVQEAARELEKLTGSDQTPSAKVRTIAIQQKPFDLGAYLWAQSLSVTTFIGDAIVVAVLSLYLLLSGDLFRRRFVELAGPTLSKKKITLQILDAISRQISRYLFVRIAISGIVGSGTAIGFWLLGITEPALWGVAAGVLNIVPYVGPATIVGAGAVAAFVQFHSVTMGFAASAVATTVTAAEAYVITPWLTCRTGSMNAAAVFIGLVFWGWLWGLPGLFLAVPILMVIRAVSDHVEALQPIATLLK